MMKTEYKHLLILFLLSFLLRLIYYQFALSELGLMNLIKSLPDTGIYWTVSQYLLNDNINGPYWIFQVGIGYGAILAGIQTIFGTHTQALYYIHIILGSLIPVIIYKITSEFFVKRRVAFLAGLFSACSLTGITLSANLLSDVPFVCMFTFGLLIFIKGYKNSNLFQLIIAGLILGLATYVRSITLFYPLVLVAIPFVTAFISKSKVNRIKIEDALTVTAIMVILLLGWSYRNYSVNEAFTFGGNGIKTARLRLAALSLTESNDKKQYSEIITRWSQEDSTFFNHTQPTFAQEYNRDASHFLEIVKTHPMKISKQFGENIIENMTTGNYIPIVQIKSAESFWNSIAKINEYFLGWLLILLSLIGLFLLYKEQKYFAFVLFGLTYLYFSFFTGFTMWQGTRLHFPAEIIFSILSAVAISKLIDRFRSI